MSNQQSNNTPYHAPKKAIWITSVFLPAIVASLLIVFFLSTPDSVDDPNREQHISERLRPVSFVMVEHSTGPRVLKTGQEVFASLCTSCHAAGVNGAPKVGDNATWGPFIAKGFEDMLHVALNGSANGKMPARGGNPNLADLEVARAIVYMANQSGANFPEPPEPATP